MIEGRFLSISLGKIFFTGCCFHCEIKRKLSTAGPRHATNANQQPEDFGAQGLHSNNDSRAQLTYRLPIDGACGKHITGGILSDSG